MLDFRNTKFSISRPLTDYVKVQQVIGSLLRNRKWQIDRRRIESLEYLDVGCGPNIHPEVINMDWQWRPGIDICWDVRRGIPLPDACVAGVFSEHCLEHLSLADSIKVVAEFRRVLKPGGVVRVSVPDGELYLDLYAQRKPSAQALQSETARFPYEDLDEMLEVYAPIMSVNRIAREHGHLYLLDYALLEVMLERAGFVDVSRAAYLQGQDDNLLIDSEERAVESLYVEAVAP